MKWFASVGRDTPAAPAVDEIAERRIQCARVCGTWREIDEADLVERREAGDYFVSVKTDEVYQLYRGAAFASDGRVVSDQIALVFFVRPDSSVVVLERAPGPSWSERVYQRERRLRSS